MAERNNLGEKFHVLQAKANLYFDIDSALQSCELCFQRRDIYDSICMLDKIRIAGIMTAGTLKARRVTLKRKLHLRAQIIIVLESMPRETFPSQFSFRNNT